MYFTLRLLSCGGSIDKNKREVSDSLSLLVHRLETSGAKPRSKVMVKALM